MKLNLKWLAVGLVVLNFVMVVGFYMQARYKAEEYKATLKDVQAKAALAATLSTEKARNKEHEASQTQANVVAELQQTLATRDQRIADLLVRVRNAQARNNPSRANSAPSAQATSGGHGEQDTGLRSLDVGDLILTEVGQEELAKFAVSANITKETLFFCRKLLRQAWQMSN